MQQTVYTYSVVSFQCHRGLSIICEMLWDLAQLIQKGMLRCDWLSYIEGEEKNFKSIFLLGVETRLSRWMIFIYLFIYLTMPLTFQLSGVFNRFWMLNTKILACFSLLPFTGSFFLEFTGICRTWSTLTVSGRWFYALFLDTSSKAHFTILMAVPMLSSPCS